MKSPSSRSPRLLMGVGLIVVVALAVLLGRTGFGLSNLPSHSTSLALSNAAAGPFPESDLCSLEKLVLRRGGTVAGALLESGVEPATAGAVVTALEEKVDLRRIRPRDRLTMRRSPEGVLMGLELQQRPEERVVVERGDGGFRARVQKEPVEILVRRLDGVVQDNLYLSMDRAGGSPALLLGFADLFSWDFDFFTDTRDGDIFQVLVEERRVGGERTGFGRILHASYRPVGSGEAMRVYRHEWDGGAQSGYYTPDGHSIRKFFLKSPLNYRRISSHFTNRRFHPILKKYRPHLGIDYAAPMGTPVVALGNGKVAFAGWRRGFGRTVQIKHNKTYLTQYAHLSRYARGITPGVRVKQGQVIGYVGSSGLSTGPHLDFRVKAGGKWVNPLALDGGRSEPLPGSQRDAFAGAVKRIHALVESLAAGEALYLGTNDISWSALAAAQLDTLKAS